MHRICTNRASNHNRSLFSMYVTKPWIVCQYAGFSTAEESPEQGEKEL
uniref:Methylmalonyl-CoA mutase alpha/beta chain catalytic domain-containing protein n=1 Tax=Candidatus Kentrum sp. DK TaxID=2126562 RepID=A0A450SEG3_9GAMM|nr:MAG: hypothetical protein BECKDK2373C_GA0170839_103118 [Candidatus Kentron sp. DK]